LIGVDKVSFSYEGSAAVVLKNISFEANEGEFVSIIGPSGCGKSTLLRIVAGLVRASSGSVTYMGHDITSPIPEISFVFQDFALLPWLTNVQNVMIGLSRTRMSQDKKEQKAMALLKEMGLESIAKSYPNTISGGMKQRVAIARALASGPKVLLMDEPFSALDELTARALRSEIVTMLKSKKITVDTVIMVTHNVEEAVELSDRIIVLSSPPTVVKKTESVGLKYPRDKRSDLFLTLTDALFADLK
jgi:NitT/TauT family transport system ATP-binding protein